MIRIGVLLRVLRVGLFLTLCLVVHCIDREARYAVDLENCLRGSGTCKEYVTCRKDVSAEFERQFVGCCDKDGEFHPDGGCDK